MTGARLVVAVVVASTFVAAMLPAGAATVAGGNPPDLRLATDVLTPGQAVAINGTGWSRGTTLQAVLCGANAVDGSADCAEAAAATMSPGPNGVVQGTLQVVLPPQPCPCEVVVSSLTSANVITFPVEVVGAPTAPVHPATPNNQPPTIKVRARITSDSSIGALFGGPASRTLVLTVTNTGQSTVVDPVVSADWGRKGHTDHPITTPTVGGLAPGATKRIAITFELDPFSYGSYAVAGRVTGSSAPVRFKAETSTWPWGLFVLLALAAQLVLLALRNALRRRIAAREAREARRELEPAPVAVASSSEEAGDEGTEDPSWADAEADELPETGLPIDEEVPVAPAPGGPPRVTLADAPPATSPSGPPGPPHALGPFPGVPAPQETDMTEEPETGLGETPETQVPDSPEMDLTDDPRAEQEQGAAIAAVPPPAGPPPGPFAGPPVGPPAGPPGGLQLAPPPPVEGAVEVSGAEPEPPVAAGAPTGPPPGPAGWSAPAVPAASLDPTTPPAGPLPGPPPDLSALFWGVGRDGKRNGNKLRWRPPKTNGHKRPKPVLAAASPDLRDRR